MTMDSRKVRVDTSAIDGLRGFAVFHIILGHLFLYSNFRELSFKNLFGSPELVWDGPCPKGWLRLKDRCYGGECDTAFRDEAERACQKMVEGGHLYMVDSVEENGLVLSGLFRPDPWVIQTWIWFGAKKSHIWQGPDGQVLNASLWDSEAGEPNNQGGHENCTASWGYRLYDTPCEGVMYPLRFICEVPARMESCESPCPDGPVGQREDKCEVDTTNGWREGCGTSGGIYLMGGGSMGLFYIISGFVMAVGYCQVMLEPPRGCAYWALFCWPVSSDGRPPTEYGKLKACDFWIRRLARLAPMYLLTNIAGLVLRRSFVPDRPTAEPDRWDSYVLTFLGLTSWSLRFPMGNELTWTISTMLFFYLCFPVLAPRIQRIPVSWLPAVAWVMHLLQSAVFGGLFVSNTENYWVRMFPLLRLPIFIMGMCCGLIRVHQQRLHNEALELEIEAELSPVSVKDRPREVDSNCCCCALEPCLHPLCMMAIWFVVNLAFTIFASQCSDFAILLRGVLEIGYPMLFFYWVLSFTNPQNQQKWIVRFFKSRFMRFLGDISMCSYMIHMLLAEVIGYAILRQAGNYPWWMVLAVTPATILLGWCFTTFYEKPISRCIRPDKRARRFDVGRSNESPSVIGSPTQNETTDGVKDKQDVETVEKTATPV